MRARGHALLLVMMMLAALSVTGAILGTRLATDLRSAHEDTRRDQLMWLARSAAAHKRSRTTTVLVGGERVRLQVAVTGRRTTATAAGVAGTAVVTRGGEGYQERFQRAR